VQPVSHADKLAQAKLSDKVQRQVHKQQLQEKKAAKEEVLSIQADPPLLGLMI
jgi:hypothetical protein